MPSSSETQKRYFQMVAAVKAGHVLKNLRPGTMAKLRETAKSMTNKQIADFATVAKKPASKGKG